MPEPVVNEAVGATTTSAESSSVENQSVENPTVDKSYIENFFNEDQDPTEENLDNEEPTVEDEGIHPQEEVQEEPKKGYERRMEQLNEDIRGKINHRKSLIDQINQLTRVVEAQASIDQDMVTPEMLEATGMTREEALYQASLMNYQAVARQRELDRYKADIESLNNGLAMDRMELLRDYPIFDAGSDQYDQAFTEKALDMYSRFANVQFDDSGMVVGADAKLYDFMSEIASLSEIRSEAAKNKARKDIQKTMSSVSPVGADNAPAVDETKKFVEDFFKQ